MEVSDMKNTELVIMKNSTSRFHRLCQNADGTALVEFAITLPVLLILYLGCVQICDAVSIYRKTTVTARTIADLTSQQTQVSDSELDSIMTVSSQVMAPHSSADLRIVISQLTVDSSGVAKVDWSRAAGPGATAATVGSTYSLPAGVAVNGTSIVVSQVNYSYSSDLGALLPITIPLGDRIFMYPRSITKIPKV
jgi:Flp pilus assembly protein TadG